MSIIGHLYSTTYEVPAPLHNPGHAEVSKVRSEGPSVLMMLARKRLPQTPRVLGGTHFTFRTLSPE